MKILIFGIPGSGKTTFANRLSIATGIPLFHIDRHLFEKGKGWRKRPVEQFLYDVEEELKKESWIIEGNGMQTLETRYKEADLVIFCALPLPTCFYRVFARAFLRKTRPDCPDGAGHWITWRLLKYMWRFKEKYGPMIQDLRVRYPSVECIEARSDDALMQLYNRFFLS